MVVLGEESVKEALEMLIPGIISILDQQKTTWGPKLRLWEFIISQRRRA